MVPNSFFSTFPFGPLAFSLTGTLHGGKVNTNDHNGMTSNGDTSPCQQAPSDSERHKKHRLTQAVQSGGGGNRTRRSMNVKLLHRNTLRKPLKQCQEIVRILFALIGFVCHQLTLD